MPLDGLSMPAMMRKKRYEPQTEAYDQFSQHIQETPEQSDFAPSLKRRLLAALAGGLTGLKDPSAGMDISTGIVEQPFRQAQSRHQTMGKSLLERMKMEQNQNEISRMHANDEMDYETQLEGVEQRREAERTRNEQAAERNRILADKTVGDAEARQKETERKEISDKLLAAHRNRMAGIAEQRAGAYAKFAENSGGRGKEEQAMLPNRQKMVSTMAQQEVARDPRYAKYVGAMLIDGSVEFKWDKMPDIVRKSLERAIKDKEFEIANKRASDFQPGSGEVLPEDVVDWEDDEDDDLPELAQSRWNPFR